RHVELAETIEARVRADDQFVLAAPRRLNLVCFRAAAGDEVTQTILDEVNESGQALLTHTRMDDHLVVRMSIGQTTTEAEHVDRAWELITEIVSSHGQP